jgi:hypothetical protein
MPRASTRINACCNGTISTAGANVTPRTLSITISRACW